MTDENSQQLADEISAHYHPIAMTLFGLFGAADPVEDGEGSAEDTAETVDAADVIAVPVVRAALRIWQWVATGPHAQRRATATGEPERSDVPQLAALAGLDPETAASPVLGELPLTERAWATLLLSGMVTQAGSHAVTVGLEELFGPVAEAVAENRDIVATDEQAGALARWLSVWALAAANHWQQVNARVVGAGDLDIPLFSTLAMYLSAGGRVQLPASEAIHAALASDERLHAHTAKFFGLLGYAPETIAGESFAHVVLAGTAETLLRILTDWRAGGLLVPADEGGEHEDSGHEGSGHGGGAGEFRAHPGARLSLISLVSLIQGAGADGAAEGADEGDG